MFSSTLSNLSKNNNKTNKTSETNETNNTIIEEKTHFTHYVDEGIYKNDCSSKIASFNPSKLSSPNLFMSNLKYRMRYYGCNDALTNDILSI